MKIYRVRGGDKYNRYFIYRNLSGYEGGKLYAISWYYSLCDWMGYELDGFYSVYDEVAALDEGYYSEDTQTLVYPLVDGEELRKDDPCCFNRLKVGMKATLSGVCYTNY